MVRFVVIITNVRRKACKKSKWGTELQRKIERNETMPPVRTSRLRTK